MDLTGTKVVVLVLLGLIKLASGLLPLVLTRILRRKSDRGLRKFIGQSSSYYIWLANWLTNWLAN